MLPVTQGLLVCRWPLCNIRLLLLWSKADNNMVKVNALICVGQHLKQLSSSSSSSSGGGGDGGGGGGVK